MPGEPLQQLVAKLGPRLLAATEHDRHLDLVALLEEPLDVTFLSPVVVRVNFRADLDFLDDGLSLVLTRFPGFERRLVLELAVVHQLADRWSRGRRDFDQVEVCFLSKPEGVGNRHDPYLLTRWAYQPYFRYPDTLVDARFSADVTSCVTVVPTRDLPGSGNLATLCGSKKPRMGCMRGHHEPQLQRHEPVNWLRAS